MNLSLPEIAPYLLIAIIVLINLALWASLRNRATHDQIEMLRKASKIMRKPWEKEDRALLELSERVKNLRSRKDDIQNSNEE
ncbi:MAG: hypothetical protein WCG34_01860 [Leptolinea sp.]